MTPRIVCFPGLEECEAARVPMEQCEEEFEECSNFAHHRYLKPEYVVLYHWAVRATKYVVMKANLSVMRGPARRLLCSQPTRDYG